MIILKLQVTILNTNHLHTVILYQVFLSNTNNFQNFRAIDVSLTDTSQSGSGSNGNKGGDSIFLRAPNLELHH